MSWFRRKGNYWYFAEIVEGAEIHHYVGDDKAVMRKLVNKVEVNCPECKKKDTIAKLPDGSYHCSGCNKTFELRPKKKL